MAPSHDSYIIRCPACGAANQVPAESEGRSGKCGSCHAALPPLYRIPVALTDQSFDEFVVHYPGQVLAEFWAPW